MYVQRPLTASILACQSKVAIIEGARAVGKTSLAHNELESRGFAYYSLAEQNTYDYASRNLSEWVNGLKLPAIIDEAQRIPDLPLAIKERVDRLPNVGLQVVLTGSASINRKGLEGQDPLARRSRRFTLHPLTRREIAQNPGSIVDDLWEGSFDQAFQSDVSRRDLYDLVALGGFPQYALGTQLTTPRERYLSIRDDIDGVLGDTILPGEQLDKTIAHAVLRSLLGLPGGILKVSRIASDLGYDSRTISRYIGIFERRFLIHSLPNLRLAAHKQNVAHSKIHPVDTSFSCELLSESGKDPLSEPALFGGIFESFVVNQLVAAAQWSRHLPDSFYWRELGSKPNEVDLVLISGEELIGIEVKAASSIDASDFRGLRALSSDPRFKRGFVIYTGNMVVQEADNLWALPVSALWEKGAFMEPSKELSPDQARLAVASPQPETSLDQPVDARILLSYRHEDNEYLDGAIVRLADDIAREYKFQSGSTGLEVFVDSRSISWGEEWQSALNSAVDATTFIMPSVTPSYLSSQACREELQRFVSRGEELANGHILSLIWQDYHSTPAAAQNPSAVETIERYQYRDVSDLRDLDPSDKTYKGRIRELAQEIRRIVLADANKASLEPSDSGHQADNESEEPSGLIDRISNLDASLSAFKTSFESMTLELNNIQIVISSHPAPQAGNIDALRSWCEEIERDAKAPVSSMCEKLADSRKAWNDVCDTTKAFIKAAAVMRTEGQPLDISDLRMQLTATRAQFDQIGDLEQQLAPLKMLTVLSPRLRFLSDGLYEFVNTVRDMKASLDDLIEQTDQVE